MTNNSLELRRQKYFEISSLTFQLDHHQLNLLFDQSESNESSTGWGMNHMIVFGQSKVGSPKPVRMSCSGERSTRLHRCDSPVFWKMIGSCEPVLKPVVARCS